jgi:hypothetical protein
MHDSASSFVPQACELNSRHSRMTSENKAAAARRELLTLINAGWTTQAIRAACQLELPEAMTTGLHDVATLSLALEAMPPHCAGCCVHWSRWICVATRAETASS